MQVSEDELQQYIASQQQAGHKLPGITPSLSKPQVSFDPQHTLHSDSNTKLTC